MTKDNPARIRRDLTIANDRVSGLSYAEIAKKYGMSKQRAHQILQDSEIKTIIEHETSRIITMIPSAIDVYQDILDDKGDKKLQMDAARDITKIAGIMPGNVQNAKIQNIYNIQQNVTLNPGVSKALSGPTPQDDPDVIDVTPDNDQ